MSNQLPPPCYIDQNILGFQRDGFTNFHSSEACLFVYSDVHFNEIGRSATPEKFLDILASMDAKYLALEPTPETEKANTPYSQTARLILDDSPHDLFARYQENGGSIDDPAKIFSAVLTNLYGKSNPELLLALPAAVENWFKEIEKGLPASQQLQLPEFMGDISRNFANWLAETNPKPDIEKIRKSLLGNKNGAGRSRDKNAIQKVWEKIKENTGLDEADFFMALEKSGVKPPTSLYDKVIRYCALLNLFGFSAEEKIRNPKAAPNVLDDARHAGMAAYCRVLITGDEKLSMQASAIYKHLRPQTQVAYFPKP